MQINSVNNNNVNFGKLHIKPTATNKLAVERFLSRNPEATREFLSDINRESGNEDIYLCSGAFDSGNIDVALIDKKGNLYGVKRIGLGSPENIQRSFEKFVNVFARKTMIEKPNMPAKNDEVEKILNSYA